MVDYVDANYVQRRREDGRTKVLNVLSEEQFEQVHIPGSLNVPEDAPDFGERVQQAIPDKSTPLVVHCSSMTCPASTRAVRRLEALGYTEVYDYKAGIEDWVGDGRETEQGPAQAQPQGRPVRRRGQPRTGTRTHASRADPVASELES